MPLLLRIKVKGGYNMKERKEINIQIGERIRIAREAASLTQEKLADYVGVTVQYISDLERGIVGTSIPTLLKLCNVLKVSSDYILTGQQSSPDLSPILQRLSQLSSDQMEIVENGINLLIEALSFQSHS